MAKKIAAGTTHLILDIPVGKTILDNQYINLKNGADMTPEEKREKRFRDWLKTDVKFNSPAAEKA